MTAVLIARVNVYVVGKSGQIAGQPHTLCTLAQRQNFSAVHVYILYIHVVVDHYS